jgi:hypothetical protein
MVYLLILFGSLFRIYSNLSGFEFFPPNFAPIAAMAFFGGYYLPKKQAIGIPLLAMFLSDLVIGFYEPLVMLSVYLSFAVTCFIAQYLSKKESFQTTLFGIAGSSFLFYFVTNAAVWINPGSSYANDLSGLFASLLAGIPFYKFTLAGDLFFNGLFFASYYLIKKHFPKSVLT